MLFVRIILNVNEKYRFKPSNIYILQKLRNAPPSNVVKTKSAQVFHSM